MNGMHPKYASDTDAAAREQLWRNCTRLGDSIEQLNRSRDLYAHLGDREAVTRVNQGLDSLHYQLALALKAYNRPSV